MLILLSWNGGGASGKPYANYGFYDPHPPPPNMAVYEFSPLEENGGRPRSRSTRDLPWPEEFDPFLLGYADREPTCQELREMWRAARRASTGHARRVVESSEGRTPIELPSPFGSSSPTTDEKGTAEVPFQLTSAGGEASVVQPKADRRRISVPPHLRLASRRTTSTAAAHHGDPRGEGAAADSANSIRVRDPAKEIYGLLRERSSAADETQRAEGKPVYGDVVRHADDGSNKAASGYFDLLRDKILRERQGDLDDQNKQDLDEADGDSDYGMVRFNAPEGTTEATPLDRVRVLVEEDSDDGGEERTESAFDRIRDKLMASSSSSAAAFRGNSRLASSSSPYRSAASRLSGTRSFRRRKEHERRRNVSDLSTLAHILFSHFLHAPAC